MAVTGRAIKRRARRAGDSVWVEWLGRIGLLAKAVSFGIVGLLAILYALGAGGRPEDREGAFVYLAKESWGVAVLVGLAIGFAAYAAWRFAQAVLNRDDEGDDLEGWAMRLGYLARGVLYASLSFLALSLVMGPRGESAEEPERTARVFDLPMGRWLVGALGIGLIGYGLWNGYRSITGKFRKHMKTYEMEEEIRPILTVAGVVGHAARMLLFAMVGFFLVRAAYQYDAREAIGFDGALVKLVRQPWGPLWLGAAGAGLFAYGVFSLLQARYRDI